MNIKQSLLAVSLAAVSLSAAAYYDYRNARVDSLEAVLASKNPPTGADLLRAYDELMRGYLPFDSLKAVDYGRKALALSYELNGLRVRADVLRYFAQIYYSREEYDEALRLFGQAMAVVDSMALYKRYSESDVADMRSIIYGAIANVYNMQDKAHLAIHYYQLALSIFEKYNWLESQTICYYNIGELYGQMGNYAEAEHNYLKAIEKGMASGDTQMMTFPKKGLVDVYFNKGDYDQALKTVNEVLAFFKPIQAKEPIDYASMLAMKARICLMKGHEDIATARSCIEEALPYIDNAQMMFDDAGVIYMAACEVAMAEKQWQKALDYGLKSVHPDSTATNADKGGYMLLAEIYTELGQKEKAREYIQKMHEVMNCYATDHYQSGLSQMEVLYETEKKEAQIAAFDKERGLYRWLLAVATVAIVALVAGIILLVIVQRRKKALLAAKVALETETKERRILARDLHDGLGGMLSVLRMRSLTPDPSLTPNPSPNGEGNFKGEGSEYIQLLDRIIDELRRTAHHLMPEELLRNGLVSALNDFAVSVPNATFQAIGDIRLEKDIELVLYRCTYELVNNALKHANATHIDIQLMQEPKQVTLTVSDDGKGMADANSKRSNLNLQQNKGMGLKNIRERIEPYKGRLDIVAAAGYGTDIHITLPI